MKETAFALARLGEDERDAQHIPTDLEWYARFQSAAHQGRGREMAVRRIAARERLLREVEANRALVGLHSAELLEGVDGDGAERSELWCAECEYERFPCRTLRHVLAIWREHPEYRPGWAPSSSAATS